jgi:murein DD-endopeptidase MepM/ murein hydrolase activator NlpD
MSHSPELKSTFFRHLAALNRPHLDNFKQWIFLPGMLFDSGEKWWGDRGRRSTPHEGLDLCSFMERNGIVKALDRHTEIPAAFAGEIVKIVGDFLGKSIYIGHAIFDDRGRQLYSAYGHCTPRHSLKVGGQVAEGEAIATISDLGGKKLAILPHVHITFAWVPKLIKISDLNWDSLRKNPGITLIDPLRVLEIY